MKKVKKSFVLALLLALLCVTGLSFTASSASAAALGATIASSEEADYYYYTVEKGDSLWSIAAKKLGSGARFVEIYKLNKDVIKNPAVIHKGQIIKIPALKVGDKIQGFVITDIRKFDLLNADLITYKHIKTGALVMHIANEDTNRTFEITFRTPAETDMGVSHVFEHSTLDGSKKYPSKALFFNLSYQTYNTYMNAGTYNFMTTYPIASLSEAQLLKYADYYTDSCFNPMIYEDQTIFSEECWRYVLNSADDELTISGTVYNEMKGSYTIASAAYNNFGKTILPGATFGNNAGGIPEFIPDMTYQDLINYHKTYYHPSNSLTCLYGKIDNVPAFLKLLNGYFKEYKKANITITESNYTEPVNSYIEKRYEYGLEEGSDTKNGVIAYYGFVCSGIDNDTLNQLDLLCSLLDDGSSVFAQAMKAKLPQASAACYFDFSGAEPVIYFRIQGVNEEDLSTFKQIVDDSMATVAKDGFDEESVDAIVAANKLDILLSGEGSSIGTDMIPNFCYYWAGADNLYGFGDYVDSLDFFGTYAKDGTFTGLVDKYLVNNERKVLAYTVPVAGLKEKQDAALAEKLAAKKASLSDAEIEKLVADTKAYAEEKEEDDASEYVKQLQAVTVASLPEEVRIFDFNDNTEDGIRKVDIKAGVDGLGHALLLLDAGGVTQEQIHYFKLFTSLLGDLDTEKYTQAQLSSKITRYLNSPVIKVSLFEADNEQGFSPYLRVSFITMDEDMQAAYDLIYEIIYNTKFDDVDTLKGYITNLKTSTKNSINGSSYSVQLYRAIANSSNLYSYYSYMNYLEYYDFLCTIEELMETEPETVINNLKSLAVLFNNKTNAVSGFVGNEASIENHRAAADAFLAKLDTKPIEAQTYTFEKTTAADALIIDGSVNFNLIFADMSSLGIDGYTSDLDAVTALVSDTFLYPLIRDQYGAYGVMHGINDFGMYIVSYRDPNVLETFEVYTSLPEMIKELEVDQETLDGYILSQYSGYALSDGELSSGFNALTEVIAGVTQGAALQYMKELKSLTPEKFNEYAKIYANLIEKGIISTSGSASVINKYADLYENILNPFGVVDSSKVEFSDVKESDEFYAAVRYVFENSLMKAVSDTEFGAAEPGTLGDLATGFFVMIGGPYDQDYAISYLSQYGIVPAGKPADVLTKQDIATYTSNFFQAVGYPAPTFSDFPKYSIKGLKDPDAKATRADVAEMLAYVDQTE